MRRKKSTNVPNVPGQFVLDLASQLTPTNPPPGTPPPGTPPPGTPPPGTPPPGTPPPGTPPPKGEPVPVKAKRGRKPVSIPGQVTIRISFPIPPADLTKCSQTDLENAATNLKSLMIAAQNVQSLVRDATGALGAVARARFGAAFGESIVSKVIPGKIRTAERFYNHGQTVILAKAKQDNVDSALCEAVAKDKKQFSGALASLMTYLYRELIDHLWKTKNQKASLITNPKPREESSD